MARSSRLRILSGLGLGLFLIGALGHSIVAGFGASATTFSPRALGWGVVMFVGAILQAIASLRGARESGTPRFDRVAGIVLLVLGVIGLPITVVSMVHGAG
jgi:hypothetical protein